MTLFAEVHTTLGETYYQCREHYDASLNMTASHIATVTIPPTTASAESYCSQCVMKTLARIGADRIDPPAPHPVPQEP